MDLDLFSPALSHTLLYWSKSSVRAACMKPTGNNSLCWRYQWFSAALANSIAQWMSLAAGRWGWGKTDLCFQHLQGSASLRMSPWTEGWENLFSSNCSGLTSASRPGFLPPTQLFRKPRCNSYHFVPIPFSLYSNIWPEKGCSTFSKEKA